jgi:Lysine methyltransferase
VLQFEGKISTAETEPDGVLCALGSVKLAASEHSDDYVLKSLEPVLWQRKSPIQLSATSNSNYSMTSASYTLTDGTVVSVTEDIHKVDGLGGEVWPGAKLLCQHLERSSKERADWQQTSVLELGAGAALVSLVAAALGAAIVLATDEYPDLLQDNIAAFTAEHPQLKARLQAHALTWGEPLPTQIATVLAERASAQQPLLVCGSEILPMKGGHTALLHTLATLCAACSSASHFTAALTFDVCPGGMSAVCSRPRVCSTHHFIELAQSSGWKCEVQVQCIVETGDKMGVLHVTRQQQCGS